MKDHTLEMEMEKLREIRKSIEYYAWQRQRALEGIARIEKMASEGEIGIDEYDALMRGYTRGMPLEQLKHNYDNLILKNRMMENKIKENIDNIEKEHEQDIAARKNEIENDKLKEKYEFKRDFLLIAFIAVVSISLFASSYLKNSATGFTAFSQITGKTAPSDFLVDSIVVTVVFITIPLLVIFMLKIFKIFKNKP